MKDYNKKVWVIAYGSHVGKIIHGDWSDIISKRLFNWTSCSRAYKTKKELVAGEGILSLPCNECGSPISACYTNKSDLISRNLCFGCNHWYEKLSIKDHKNVARIGGSHYQIEPDNPKAAFQGFGGSKFTIRFNDGREVTTRNLWHQGEIPKWFRSRLTDNAVFI